jgi:hypothetical protein
MILDFSHAGSVQNERAKVRISIFFLMVADVPDFKLDGTSF